MWANAVSVGEWVDDRYLQDVVYVVVQGDGRD